MQMYVFTLLVHVLMSVKLTDGSKVKHQDHENLVIHRKPVEKNMVHEHRNIIMPLIIDGVKANETLRRSMALVYGKKRNGEPVMCSGTIIGTQHVLSAAHCFQLAKNVFVDVSKSRVYLQEKSAVLESVSTIPYEVEKIYVHKDWDYTETTWENDIAIVKLRTKLPESQFVDLSFGNPPEHGTEVIAAGYGTTSDKKTEVKYLMQGNLIYTSPEICGEIAGRDIAANFPEFYVCSMIRKEYSKVCSGDSGGGVFYFGEDGELVQFGITSFGTVTSCITKGEAAVFTRIMKYEESIEDIMDKGCSPDYMVLS